MFNKNFSVGLAQLLANGVNDSKEEEKSDTNPPPVEPKSIPNDIPTVSTGIVKSSTNFDIDKMETVLPRFNEVFMGTGMSSIGLSDTLDTTDPRWVNALQAASDMLDEFITILSEHMVISRTDKLITAMMGAQKIIAQRYYFKPLKLYIKGEIVALMRRMNKPAQSKGVMGSLSANGTSLEISNIGNIDGEVLRNRIEQELNSSDLTYQNVQEQPMDPRDTLKLLEERNRKISHIKFLTKENINSWVYMYLPCHQFLKVLGGCINQNHLTSMVMLDMTKLIFSCWSDKNDKIIEIGNSNQLDSIGLYKIEDVNNMIKNMQSNPTISETTILSYIDMEKTNPIGFAKLLFSPGILSAVQRSWNIVELMLEDLKLEKPFVTGFMKYRMYNTDKNIPDMRLIYQPDPVYTSDNIKVEFCALVSVYLSIAREASAVTPESRYQIKLIKDRNKQAINNLVLQLRKVGFDGLTPIYMDI